ncbi:hypothetical protein [Poseidonocella sedimentorum]|uniref:Lipoprotein n=1 Tax=Poseidonocella sedimentorum TaxID=871652 RepID=A0A1I6CST5_9RHOB|nr:hypothetical protein [Poseidonocella sedimentorum]SFQ96305.1 hypothetical protein SAMN04515673_101318 [Poseidonocella sedimentorum]
MAHSKQIIARIALLGALVGLAGCGDTMGEQLIYGAAAGAGAAVATDGDIATGAVVGAGANAAYCQTNPGACN